jgi:hypothetical protein
LFCFCLIRFALVTRYRLLATCRDENIYVINHNSVRDSDRDFLIRANSCHITSDCHRFDLGPISKCNRPDAKSSGDDEADDGNVEAQ